MLIFRVRTTRSDSVWYTAPSAATVEQARRSLGMPSPSTTQRLQPP